MYALHTYLSPFPPCEQITVKHGGGSVLRIVLGIWLLFDYCINVLKMSLHYWFIDLHSWSSREVEMK